MASIALKFRHGWCRLAFDVERDARTLSATTVVDCFRELLRAVVALLDGALTSTCPWAGEGEGVFIDMAKVGDHVLSIVIHQMADPDYIVGAESWAPIRGSVVGTHALPLDRFVLDLTHELWRIRVTDTDELGYIEHWGWRFPTDLFDVIEGHALSVGYVPRPPEELAAGNVMDSGDRS